MPSSTEWIWIYVIIAISIVDVILISILICYYCFCYRKRGSEKKPVGLQTTTEGTREDLCQPLRAESSFERRGLRNLGNTCYFNSAIQCLASTPILRSQVPQIACDNPVSSEFVKFLAPIDPENGFVSSSLDPKPLLTAFCAKVVRFRGTQQHDSHELLRHFLDQLRQEERASWTNINPKLTSVDKVFGGHFMTVYICDECKTPYHICEPFLDISVPICVGDLSTETLAAHQIQQTIGYAMSPYQKAVKSIMERLTVGPVNLPREILSISDCLQYFSRQELLGPQYMCNNCAYNSPRASRDLQGSSNLTRATKQTLIFNPPAVMVIHLKRFEMKSPRFEKRSNFIKFEELLDLAPYCSSWCKRNKNQEKNIWYSLYGVVVHSGTLNSGHYIAYVKERTGNSDIEGFLQKEYLDRDVTEEQLVEMMRERSRTGRREISTTGAASRGIWYCMNDSRVSEVSVKEVLRQEAFLLFYERVPPLSHGMSSYV